MEKKHYPVFLVIAFIGFLVLMTACSPSTFGQMSERGNGIFSTYCTCHHSGGAGAPTLGHRLSQNFNNAQQVYDKIRTQMPYDLPGVLAASEYQQVLSYILLQNSYVNAEDTFDLETLSQIAITE